MRLGWDLFVQYCPVRLSELILDIKKSKLRGIREYQLRSISGLFWFVIPIECKSSLNFSMSASFIEELDHPEVLLLGDSILYHVRRYPHVLQGREVCNMCVPGQKSYRLYDDLDFAKDKASHHLSPDHPYCQRNVSKIVVHIGTNDLPLYLENPGSISQRLIDIIELIQDRIHRTSPTGSKSVYLLGLLPRQGKNDPETFLDNIKEINAILENHFCGQGIFIKPPLSLADDDGTVADPKWRRFLIL